MPSSLSVEWASAIAGIPQQGKAVVAAVEADLMGSSRGDDYVQQGDVLSPEFSPAQGQCNSIRLLTLW